MNCSLICSFCPYLHSTHCCQIFPLLRLVKAFPIKKTTKNVSKYQIFWDCWNYWFSWSRHTNASLHLDLYSKAQHPRKAWDLDGIVKKDHPCRSITEVQKYKRCKGHPQVIGIESSWISSGNLLLFGVLEISIFFPLDLCCSQWGFTVVVGTKGVIGLRGPNPEVFTSANKHRIWFKVDTNEVKQSLFRYSVQYLLFCTVPYSSGFCLKESKVVLKEPHALWRYEDIVLATPWGWTSCAQLNWVKCIQIQL